MGGMLCLYGKRFWRNGCKCDGNREHVNGDACARQSLTMMKNGLNWLQERRCNEEEGH